MNVAATLFALLVLVGPEPAVPRLDGQWRLDPAKSGVQVRADFPDVTLAVRQSATDIVFEIGSVGKSVTRYTFGEPSVNVSPGEKTTAMARWQDGRLVATGHRERADGRTLPYRLVVSLSESDELQMEETLTTTDTEFVSRRVFHRVK